MSVTQPTSVNVPTNSGQSPIVTPHPPRWYQKVAATLVWMIVRAISATVRFKWSDRSNFFRDNVSPPVILCVWHNRLALSIPAYYAWVRRRTSSLGMAAMVSASKDGAFLSAILTKFKVQPVRGSSSRRGRQALLELVTWAEKGYDLAITPDGPRGPCYRVQDGVVSLAQITGMPIIPASFQIRWKIRPNSWDRFQVPLPFTRCEVILEKPIHVPREASDAEREELRQLLESRLQSITKD